MRTSRLSWIVLLMPLAAVAAQQAPSLDPERILAERFGFSAREVSQAREGRPAVKVQADKEELFVIGAVRMPGRKERLADWLKNIQHFRGAAELGVTHVVPSPPAAASFASLSLDAADLAELQQCRPEKCAIRLSGDAMARLQRDVAWGSANAASQANDIFRQMLLGYASAYVKSGHAGIAAYDGPNARRSFADDMRQLIRQSTTLSALAPEFIAYLDGYPAATLPGADQIFYWSAMPAGSNTILSVHHLVLYRRRAGEFWIADKNVYASRYFDAAGLAIGLYDTPDGSGYYAVAGSRMKSSSLTGVGTTVLRRQIERTAGDTVKMYLEWLRESLAQPGLNAP
jgi:hypothetical protein